MRRLKLYKETDEKIIEKCSLQIFLFYIINENYYNKTLQPFKKVQEIQYSYFHEKQVLFMKEKSKYKNQK